MMKDTAKDPESPFGWDLVNDLGALPDDEEAIVSYLEGRHKRGEIYTWVGSLLLSIHPGDKETAGLYDDGRVHAFANISCASGSEIAPHIFAITAKARHRLLLGLGKVSQVIVISGESGTGKSFNACQALNFLAAVDRDAAGPRTPSRLVDVTKRIGGVCPLISAFSTANTERNTQSSRHGQLIRLLYEKGVIHGVQIDSFLLERSRVTKGCDNFLIFYQMLAGLSESELETLGLTKSTEYRILGCRESTDKSCYMEGFKKTVQAMEELGFSEERRKDVFKVLASLIHMGNVSFREKDGKCSVNFDDEGSRRALESISNLTTLSIDDVAELFTSILICPQSWWRRYTVYRRDLTCVEACQVRVFSIVKCLYERLFHWLVDAINQVLTAKGDQRDWLGILDIFGFESFSVNGIEQLCVNYANERLQLYFMEEHLESGRRDLREEGLCDVPPMINVDIYKDRLFVMETILFSALNDACQSPVMPDINSLQQQVFWRRDEAKRFLSTTKDLFVIKHYSSPVEYRLEDLLNKNIDKVPTDLASTFTLCKNKLFRDLANVEENELTDNGRVSVKKCTTLAKLRARLDTLLKELRKCDSHYVRCVKPCNVGEHWAKDVVIKRLADSGVLDALPLARCKYPVYFSYEEFCRRYPLLSSEKHDPKVRCKFTIEMVTSSKGSKSKAYFGNRFIFLTESSFFEMERFRRKYRSQCARRIQLFWRRRRLRNVIFHKETKEESPVNGSNRGEGSSATTEDEVFLCEDVEIEAHPKFQNLPIIYVSNCEQTERLITSRNTGDEKNEMNRIIDSLEKSRESNETCYIELLPQAKKEYIKQWLDSISTSMESSESEPPDSVVTILIRNSPSKSTHNNHKDPFSPTFDRNQVENKKNSPCCKKKRKFNFSDPVEFLCKLGKGRLEGRAYVVSMEGSMIFYKAGILSRRRLCQVPVRFHTRFTCFPNSHRIPWSELPRGLQDCL
ncbi:myosin-K heavy chain [Orussus abietinus]|uniref:myosin-K heavy chain n=1 Tax=Orussus abietinus TaxID=222816 RepID=UPI0006268F03|nr:myosin-K heavy chain [Orussus abietinus]